MSGWHVTAMLLGLSAVLPTTVQTQGRSSGRPDPTLTRLADAAQQGQRESDKALRWVGHFMKGPDGKTYVPYTLLIDAARGTFETASVYVRVVEGAVYDAERRHTVYGNNAAPLPPGAQVGTAPEPTVLANAGANLAGARRVFEDAFRLDTRPAADSRVLRGAMTLRPGAYDVYITVDDRTRGSDASSALMRQRVVVPDFSKPGLALSSILVVDRLETLSEPVTDNERAGFPYALGATNLVPRLHAEFRQHEALSIAFMVYGATPDDTDKPAVDVRYRLVREGFAADRVLGTTAERLDRTTLPADFDIRAGHQLVPTHTLPLMSYDPGEYRLVIAVADRRTGANVDDQVRFRILP